MSTLNKKQVEVCFTGFDKPQLVYLQALAKEKGLQVIDTVIPSLSLLVVGDEPDLSVVDAAKKLGVDIAESNDILNKLNVLSRDMFKVELKKDSKKGTDIIYFHAGSYSVCLSDVDSCQKLGGWVEILSKEEWITAEQVRCFVLLAEEKNQLGDCKLSTRIRGTLVTGL